MEFEDKLMRLRKCKAWGQFSCIEFSKVISEVDLLGTIKAAKAHTKSMRIETLHMQSNKSNETECDLIEAYLRYQKLTSLALNSPQTE